MAQLLKKIRCFFLGHKEPKHKDEQIWNHPDGRWYRTKYCTYCGYRLIMNEILE